MRAIRRHIILPMLLLLLPLGCTRFNEWGSEDGGEGIRLTVWCQDPETKAGANGEKPGEQEYNENLISTLDVFYYPEGAIEDPAVLHERFTPERNNSATVISYTSDYFIHNVLVPSGNSSFWVYVIANYPGDVSDFSTNSVLKSIDELKELAIESDFNENLIQDSFVMDGLVQLPADRNRREVANGTVQLKRLAAKLSVHIRVPEFILNPVTIDGLTVMERWEPMISDDGNGNNGMMVYLEQAVGNAKLGGSPLTTSPSPDYFTYDRRGFAESTDVADASYPFITLPFYTYPSHWEYASKKSPTKEPTLKLILPWKRIPDNTQGAQITATQRQFYYKIIIPDDLRESSQQGEEYLRRFVRNNWYKLKVSVGMLGSETNEDAIEVGNSYYVCHWQDKEVVVKHAEIGKARFLSVERDNYVLNNENTLSIPISSSHPVQIVDISASKPNLKTGNNDSYSSAAADWLRVTADASGAHVVFNHPLNNDITDANLDCSPYTISFTIVHSDQAANLATATYKQTVTITQYPAIYIKSEQSNGTVYLNGITYSGSNSSITVNDNGNPSNDIGSIVNPSGVDGSASDNTNNNQYLYTLYVTVLPSSSSAVIGDPRTDGSSAVVTTLNDLNSTANYRPVAENTQNVIAPIVKIASSYGKTHALFYSNARTRCAAYQEYGYPAGRWRLPTVAEIEFFVALSEKNIIPTLFNPGQESESVRYNYTNYTYKWYNYYWAGGYRAYHGVGDTVAATVHQDKEGSWNHYTNYNNTVYSLSDSSYEEPVTVGNATYDHNLVYTRCVYDVWYWGDTKDSAHLTDWGRYQTTR